MPSLTPGPTNRPSGQRTTPTYSASITMDSSLGQWHTITVTNTTAFTINAPTNPPSGTSEMVIEIYNNSGTTMGAITWNSVFKFPGITWTNPASTKRRAIRFMWNGSNWIAMSFTGADY